MNREVYRERLAAIIARIDADLSCWDQFSWHCGTSHCLAGHAQLDAGLPLDEGQAAARDGAEWLGMSEAVSKWAFNSTRKLDELRSLLEFDLSSKRDPDGYDRYGYNRAGYNRYGYDREGYNRAGYNSLELNRAGYDSNGSRYVSIDLPRP
jgi:hypothetical protein